MPIKAAKKVKGGWLFKEEPDHYNLADFEKEGATLWDGVDNNLARQNLRQVKPDDLVLYYHTGKERAIVGEMRVLAGPMPDPANDDPKAVVVKVAFVRRWPRPVTLETIKREPRLAQWDLIRLPRLSIVPVSPAQWEILEELAGKEAGK